MKRTLIVLGLLLAFARPSHAYVCAPLVPPAYPGIGWCKWQPDPGTSDHPNVVDCDANGPGWGFAYIYDAKYFAAGSHCSSVFVNQINGGSWGLQANYYFMELNGWRSYANGVTTSIKSIKLGPGVQSWGGIYTSLQAFGSPIVGDYSGGSTLYQNTGSTVKEYPDVSMFNSFYLAALY